MNNDDTRPADTSGHTAQSEQSEAAAAITRNEFDVSMEAIMAVYKDIAERFKETDAKFKETDKRLNKMYTELNSHWSRLVESLVEGKLVELLRARKVDVTETYIRRKVWYIDDNGTQRNKEFDIVARNGSEVVAFEVKTTLQPDDVKSFISVMRNFSRYCPGDASKKVYGGVAYIREESEAARYAARQGLFVIRAVGDSARIMNNAEFKPVSFTNAASAPVGGHLRAVPDC